MATDFDGAAPIRSNADGLDERVLVKIQDGANPGAAGSTVKVSEEKVHNRPHNKDSDGTDREVLVSQEGHSLTNGDYDGTLNKRPSSQGLIVSDRDASPSESTMNKRPTAVVGESDSVCLDISLKDHLGNAYDEDNPLATYLAESPAEEVDDYDDADTAVDATSNHDYVVTALKDLKSIEVPCSSSGDAKFELLLETAVASGVYITVATSFTSKHKQDAKLTYKKKVAAGITVRIAKRNDDNKLQALYSQIQGLEI
jgi:hypothetical protein